MSQEIIVGLLGIVTGCLSGLLGIGGGILLAPLLLICLPWFSGSALPIVTITGLTVAQSFFGAASALFHHARSQQRDHQLVYYFGIPMGCASLLASLFTVHLSAQVVLVTFALLAISSVLISVSGPGFWRKWLGDNDQRHWLLPVLGVILGLTCGAVGQGGGFIYLPVMIALFGCSPKLAIATAPVIGLIAASGLFVGRIASGTLDWTLCGALVIGIFIGAKVGSVLYFRFNDRLLAYCIHGFVLLSSIKIITMAVNL
ncbi:sulfite exporter TauE/SafE family protein [Photobacterium sp. 1_MG-2023]|uniref:sulfite exporter TauE/SafE family protein n=1 Tax=Photobacterium sp. 1_MG-2023 TaxID=3062646 RepID=UPI0026E26FD9|nr:sulfite exporter TauE/SafE family protein [Photobacterium sp. 1_MG-2023]MDO6705129.1 sulfite exporter TauE/SafE family protein [Photobacterium sp. 1_MG-2023]